MSVALRLRTPLGEAASEEAVAAGPLAVEVLAAGPLAAGPLAAAPLAAAPLDLMLASPALFADLVLAALWPAESCSRGWAGGGRLASERIAR